MSYPIQNKRSKVSYVWAFSLYFIISGLVLSPFLVFAAQKSILNNFSLFLTKSAVHLDTSLKKVNEKIPPFIPKVITQKPEAHLKIPKIGVNAIIKDMGMTSEGAMAVPADGFNVGWFSLGTRPGDVGSAVIGAHNIWTSRAGVFAHLDQLEKGDLLSVVDAKGVSISFIVRDIQTYDANDTNTGIFQSESGAHLNLITCSGAWDPQTQSSTKRLVVFTDRVQTTNKVAVTDMQTP